VVLFFLFGITGLFFDEGRCFAVEEFQVGQIFDDIFDKMILILLARVVL